jgi:hypothetical protein
LQANYLKAASYLLMKEIKMSNNETQSGFSIFGFRGLAEVLKVVLDFISRGCTAIYGPIGMVRRKEAEIETKIMEAEGDIEILQLRLQKAKEAKLDVLDPVSDEQMQELRLPALAREMEASGRYPARTVNFVRSLSSSDAALIERVLSFVLARQGIILCESPAFRREFDDKERMRLAAKGVLLGVISTQKSTLSVPKHCKDQIVIRDRIITIEAQENVSCEMPVYSLTDLGKELLPLSQIPANENYCRDVAETLAKSGLKVGISYRTN